MKQNNFEYKLLRSKGKIEKYRAYLTFSWICLHPFKFIRLLSIQPSVVVSTLLWRIVEIVHNRINFGYIKQRYCMSKKAKEILTILRGFMSQERK